MKKILLLGYMGVGKSVTGKILAKQLELPFYDLDELIEINLGLSVSTIFATKGEIYFRKIEHNLLNEMMEKPEQFILSLGGGTPCYANNHLVLQKADCYSFYLKASVALLTHRLSEDRENRPLLAHLTSSELNEYIAKHLFDRSYFYHQAQFTISVDNKTPDSIALEIKRALT